MPRCTSKITDSIYPWQVVTVRDERGRFFSQAGRGGARPTIYGSGKGSKSGGWGRQQCRLTICIELDELTNSVNTNSIRQQGPNDSSDTETRCLVYNGPEDWVHLTKVTSWGHIKNWNTNLDQISSSESWLSINFSIKHQYLQLT